MKFQIKALMIVFSVIILSVTGSCGRNNSKKATADVLPTLEPPSPPKPSMTGSDTIWNYAGKMPVLPGNEEALFTYIGRNLHYPDNARKNNIQGKVVVKFCVTSKGDVKDHQVIKSIDPDLDAEALRVIKTIMRFEPGFHEGKPVSVWYEVPISFVLQ
ncbi:MAG: energy transducer TonB [Bacteroidia bacterium]|nr:energy transducer TonB [Bacteroidia bacterium]